MVDQNLHPHPHLTILKFSTASRMAGKIMVSKPKMKMPEAKFPSNVRISSLGMGPWGWLVWGWLGVPWDWENYGKLWKTMENYGKLGPQNLGTASFALLKSYIHQATQCR